MATTTISISQDAYEILAKMKKKGQSFSDVIREHLRPQPRTCGDLLEELEQEFEGAPLLDLDRVQRLQAERGRRSNRPPKNR